MNEPHKKYGWVIVMVATLSLVVSNGLAIGGLPPFYKPIREEFVAIGAIDSARAESFIANCANITFLMSGVFSLLGGWLITRFSLKPLMLVGCALLGSGLLLHSQSVTAETVYAARFLMGASLGFIGVAPCVVLVSNWFDTGRGTALGIVLTGTSLGGFLIPLAAAPMIANYGWRTAMMSVSLLVWLVLLPAIIFLVKEKPFDLSVVAAPSADDGLKLVQAIKTPLFWVFAAAAALVFYPIFVTSQQFILYLQSPKIGVSAQTAAFAQSALFAVSIGGKFLAGALSDKFRAVRVIVACCFLMFAASCVLLGLNAQTSLFFLLPFALGYGGTFVLLQRLAADFFGRREIGKILGLITLIEVTGAAIGGRITGYLADQHQGDYTYAFYGVTIAAGLAFLATIAIYIIAKEPDGSSKVDFVV
ncbi:MFS transporter [soil metagenome]